MIKEDVINFVYSISKIPPKRLLFALQESKEILLSSSASKESDTEKTDLENTGENLPAFARRYQNQTCAVRKLEIPVKDITNTIDDKIKGIKYFHNIKSKPILQLNTDLINEENKSPEKNKGFHNKCENTSPLNAKRNNSHDFKSEDIDELRLVEHSELEYSPSEEPSISTHRLSGTITSMASALDTLTKLNFAKLTPESASIVSCIDSSKGSSGDYTPEITQRDSFSETSLTDTFNYCRTKLSTLKESPRETKTSIQDIKKHFNLADFKSSFETHDATFFRSETTDFCDKGKNQEQLFNQTGSLSKRSLPPLIMERKTMSCQCIGCEIF